MEKSTILNTGIVIVILLSYWTSDARKIAADGWQLYTRPDCGFCIKQKAYLGLWSFLIPSINCSSFACSGVEAYPTWHNIHTKQWHTGSILSPDILNVLKASTARKTVVGGVVTFS